MKHTTIAVDLAKSVFEIAVSEKPGVVSERRRLSRGRFLRFFANRPPATVLLEACGSAHHWARQLQGLQHRVVLMAPHITSRYVSRNKTDKADAKALLEAFRNEDIRPVPVKSLQQQALVSLHRLRSGWMATRTARLNTLRGLLRELGLPIPVGARYVLPRVGTFLGDPDSPIPEALRPALAQTCQEIRELEANISAIEQHLKAPAAQIPIVARLRSVPGIGLLTATALVALVGDIRRFPSGRHFASFLGLTPKESSSGLRRRLGAISKRGDIYLRMLLIHGARAVLNGAKNKKQLDQLRTWALQTETLRGHNKAAVALANKLARIVWAAWRKEVDFQSAAA